jgi:transposase
VSEVARRWQICAQQAFGWRRHARTDEAVPSSKLGDASSPAFVPNVATASAPAKASTSATATVIEIKLADAVVRVVSGTDVALLREVLRAVRASSSSA